jgi:uncharacterized membrane-anchored protein YitT (DUF2179 family)
MGKRGINVFEIFLLFAGLAIAIAGFFFISCMYKNTGYFGWDMLIAIFLWLCLIIMIVIAALLEDVKQELAVIIREHVEETKLLREDTKLLRNVFYKRK